MAQNIPTKTDLAKNRANDAERQREDAAYNYFRDAIVTAMNKGQTSATHQIMNVSPAALARLQADFGPQGWTLSVRNSRTGCTVSWS